MSEYEIEGLIFCLIGYTIGRIHAKRTITHECVKDTHDKTVQTEREGE